METSLPIGVFEITGEPAIIINGVPDEPNADCATVTQSPQGGGVGCGEWFEGRQVRKLFLGRYYSGEVLKFDKSTGWYRVQYEDGDSEDLDWHELEEVLLPLDVTIPLKSLALGRTQTRKAKTKTPRAERPVIGAGQGLDIAQNDGGES